jgi:MFS family permease
MITLLAAPLLCLILIGLSTGLFNTFLSLQLASWGHSAEVIGFMTSAFYIGCLIGSFRTDRWILKLGHLTILRLSTLTLALLIALQGFFPSLLFWAFARIIGGIAMGLLFIAIESWFLLSSPSEARGRALSLYLVGLYASMSVGQFLLETIDLTGASPYLLASSLSALALIPIFFSNKPPELKTSEPLTLSEVFRLSPVGFLGGVVAGMLLSSVYGLLPVYSESIGFSVNETALFMGTLIFGGLCLQWPMGRLADRTCRKKTLALASLLTAFFAASIAFFGPKLPLAWAFGGVSFTLYPLSMGFTCEKVSQEHLVAATGGFVLSWGIGAILGPLCAGLSMDQFGASGIFYFLTVLPLFLTVLCKK